MDTEFTKTMRIISESLENAFGPTSAVQKAMLSYNPQALAAALDGIRQITQAVQNAYQIKPEVIEALKRSLEPLQLREPYARLLREAAPIQIDRTGLQEIMKDIPDLAGLDLSDQETVEVPEETIEAIDQNIIELPKEFFIPIGNKKLRVPIVVVYSLVMLLIALCGFVSDQISQKQVQQYLEAIYQSLPHEDAEGIELPDEYQTETASESVAEEYPPHDGPIPV